MNKSTRIKTRRLFLSFSTKPLNSPKHHPFFNSKNHLIWQSSFMSMASHPLLYAFSFLAFSSICSCRQLDEMDNQFNLASVREFLTREEDSIVFSLIERAKYPSNFPAYDPSYLAGAAFPFHNHSLVDLFVRESEAVHAKVLYPAAAFVNVSNTVWQMYFNQLLPQFTSNGNDGRYALTAAADLVCLQALSRRIHYGRFVAEAKFRDAPNDYSSAIRAKDRDALMRLLTSLTKLVEVEYLLRRLD